MEWKAPAEAPHAIIYRMTDPLPPAPRRSTRPAGLLAVAGVALALLLYRPWEGRPFAILDFSEFLPLLRGHTGFAARLGALVHYYLFEHGRLNLASYVALAAKWTVLGADPIRWQWARFIEMGMLVGATYWLLRRLGADAIGAAAAAALFICGHTAEDGWMRLTMGEPLGLLFLLAAAVVADRYLRTTDRWRAPVIAVLVVLAILAKEMLFGAVPFVVLVAVARDAEGRLAWPRLDRRTRALLVWVTAGTGVALAAVAWAARGVGAAGFSASYGATSVSASRYLSLWQQIITPTGVRPGLATWLLPANLMLLAVCGAGIRLAWRDPLARVHLRLVLALGAGLPAIGAALYLPWPYFNLFYGLPFLIGPALVLATAVTSLRAAGRGPAVAAAAGVAVLIAFAGASAARTARTDATRQRVDGDVAAALPGRAADSIVVIEPFLPQQAWQGTGPTLARYAVAMGLAPHLPPATDVTCDQAARMLAAGPGRDLFISYSDRCGRLRTVDRRIVHAYRYLDLPGLRLATDTIEADIVGPAAR